MSLTNSIKKLRYYYHTNKYFKNFIIILSFLILSWISIIFVFHSGTLHGGTDTNFHALRIHELSASITHGNWLPQFNLYSTNSQGVADLIAYPYLNLYPIALLSIILKKATTIYSLFFMINAFVSMIVAYYSSLGVNKNHCTNYLFAIAYTFSINLFSTFFNNNDLGTFSAIALLPLVVFGIVKLIKYNQWLQLSIGMASLLYCHVLSFIIAGIFILIFLIINIKIFNMNKFINLTKAGLLTISLGGFYWYNIIKLILFNKIATPNQAPVSLINTFNPMTNSPLYSNTLKVNQYITGITISNIFKSMTSLFKVNNIAPTPLGLISLITIILGIILYKRMNHLDKEFYFISIIIILITTTIVPWNILNKNKIINIFQFTWRFYIIPEILLSYLFAKLIIKELPHKNVKTFFTILTLVISIIVLNEIGYQFTEIQATNKNNTITSSLISYPHIISTFDYYPLRTLSNINNILSNNGSYNINNSNNSIHFKMLTKADNTGMKANFPTNINKLKLPFVMYNGIKYTGKLDNKPTHISINKNIAVIHNVPSGKHKITIIPHNPNNQRSFIIMIPGLLYLLFVILYRCLHSKLRFKIIHNHFLAK